MKTDRKPFSFQLETSEDMSREIIQTFKMLLSHNKDDAATQGIVDHASKANGIIYIDGSKLDVEIPVMAVTQMSITSNNEVLSKAMDFYEPVLKRLLWAQYSLNKVYRFESDDGPVEYIVKPMTDSTIQRIAMECYKAFYGKVGHINQVIARPVDRPYTFINKEMCYTHLS